MKRVFFSQSLPQALTRDSEPGCLAGGGEGPRLRGAPRGARLGLAATATATASGGGSRRGCVRCGPRRAGAAHAEAETRTRTRKAGGRAPREGEPRGLGPRRAAAAAPAALAPAAAASDWSACSPVRALGAAEHTPRRGARLAAHLKVVACHFLRPPACHLRVVTWGARPSAALPKFHYSCLVDSLSFPPFSSAFPALYTARASAGPPLGLRFPARFWARARGVVAGGGAVSLRRPRSRSPLPPAALGEGVCPSTDKAPLLLREIPSRGSLL